MMHNHDNEEYIQEKQEDLLDLNEIMRSFGINEWKNLGPIDASDNEHLSLLVNVQGQRYVLKERTEGLIDEDPHHRYNFQHYLQQQGIPIPALWLTPEHEPMVTRGEDSFELQQWAGGEQFSTANPLTLDWIGYAGTMLGRIHMASLHYMGKQQRWPSGVHIGALVQSYLNLART